MKLPRLIPTNSRSLLGKNFARPNPSLRLARPADRTPPPPSRASSCCYNVVTPNARSGAFWCAIQCFEGRLVKVQNHACLWCHNAGLGRVTQAPSLASTPSIGTMQIKHSALKARHVLAWGAAQVNIRNKSSPSRKGGTGEAKWFRKGKEVAHAFSAPANQRSYDTK